MPRKLSVNDFKAEVKRRGWTFRALAARWNVSETWVSKIANNPDRPQQWEDAVKGLPTFKKIKVELQFKRVLSLAPRDSIVYAVNRIGQEAMEHMLSVWRSTSQPKN